MPRTKKNAKKTLYQNNPENLRTLLLGIADQISAPAPPQELASFECPHCGCSLAISAGVAPAAARVVRPRKAAGAPKRRKALTGSVNPLLVRLAKAKGVMVGAVHKEFTKSMGAKARGKKKDELRAMKLDWIKSELKRLSA